MIRRNLFFGILFLLFVFLSPSEGEDHALQTISRLCGACHGVTLNDRCLAGPCGARPTHSIRPLPWDLVIPWMKALGCSMTGEEEKEITDYLSAHYSKLYSNRWIRSGTIPNGWNVVSFGLFRNALYAGIEGNGSIFRIQSGPDTNPPAWEPVFQSPDYTIYGLVPFSGMLLAATNDPDARIYGSSVGKEWRLLHLFPGEKGITALGVLNGKIYAGTTRSRIYRSENGTDWELVQELLPGAKSAYPNWIRFIVPLDQTLFAGIEGGGVYRSEGGQWKKIWPSPENLIKFPKVTGARGAAVYHGRLYFGTGSGGEIWSIAKDGTPERAVSFEENREIVRKYIASLVVFGDSLYAGVGGSVLRSEDGIRWREGGYLTPHSIEAMAVYGNQLFAGTSLPPDAWIYRTVSDP